jgi:aminoglycoside phosphotransferase (APT) family kinase protein
MKSLETALRRCLAAEGHATPIIWKELSGGAVNHAWAAGGRVVRASSRAEGLHSFANEAEAYRIARNHAIPTPRAIGLLERPLHGVTALLVTTKLTGESLQNSWHARDDEQKAIVIRNAARTLKRIHGIEVPSFGSLVDNGMQFSTWSAFCRAYAERALERCAAARTRRPTERVHRKIIDELAPILDRVGAPKLVHGDFHFGNVLVSKNRITGVIDWEFAIGGDPLWDFRNETRRCATAPGSFRAFREGYGALTDAMIKLQFYRWLYCIDLIPSALETWVGRFPWADGVIRWLEEARHRHFTAVRAWLMC